MKKLNGSAVVAGIFALKCHSQCKEVAVKLLGFLFVPLTGLAVV